MKKQRDDTRGYEEQEWGLLQMRPVAVCFVVKGTLGVLDAPRVLVAAVCLCKRRLSRTNNEDGIATRG